MTNPATYSFGGRGRPTPVLGEQELIRLLLVLEGPKAAAFREWASSILFRYLKGDRDLANEIHLRADLLEDGEDALEAPPDVEVPPPQVQPPEARLPLELAARLEDAALMLFPEKQWGVATELLQLALQYRALLQDPKTPSQEPAPPPDKPWERTPARESSEEQCLEPPRGLVHERRAERERGSTRRPMEAKEDPLEPSLSSRQALFEGWAEISKGAALSVWEALGKYQTSPTRYPRFYRALCRLFGIRTFRESLRWGDELEQELQKRNGDTCQGVFLSRTRGKMPERNSPRFRIIKP